MEITFSASQISTYLDCPRKWAWGRIEGVRTPQHPSAKFGDEVHRQLEHHLRSGAPLDFTTEHGHVAQAIRECLPPMSSPEVEHKFRLYTGRHWYTGRIDWRDREGGLIGDHKTTSDFKWAKSPEDLDADPQAALYALTSMVEWGVPKVRLQWTYGQTRGAKRALPIVRDMTLERVRLVVDAMDDVADEMARVLQDGRRALDLEPRPETCAKYGGCPHRHLCNLGPQDTMRSIMTQGTNDLLARLAKKQASTAATAFTGMSGPAEAPKVVRTADNIFDQTAQEAAVQRAKVLVADYQVNPPEAPKEAAEPTRETVPAPAPAESPITTEPPKAEKRKYTKKERKQIGTLFVDCAVDGAERFETYVARAAEIIRATEFRDRDGKVFQIQDWRFMPFGQGGAVLVEAVLQALPDRVEELVVCGGTPEATACLNYLLHRSDRVVRGTR